MSFLRLWMGLLLGMGLSVPGAAQAAGPESTAIHVPRLNAQRNGILQQIVYGLERDPLGRVWAGTRTGPYAYDGRRWTPINLPGGAVSRQIRALPRNPTAPPSSAPRKAAPGPPRPPAPRLEVNDLALEPESSSSPRPWAGAWNWRASRAGGRP